MEGSVMRKPADALGDAGFVIKDRAMKLPSKMSNGECTYSVSYNRKKRVYVVYREERRVGAFKTEPEAWAYIKAHSIKHS